MKQATEQVAHKLSEFVASLKKPKQELGLTTRKKSCSFGVYPQLGSPATTAGLCRDLAHFLHDHKEGLAENPIFMAVFTTPSKLTEDAFNEKVQELMNMLRKAAEPFYCTPEAEKVLDQTSNEQTVEFGGRVLKVVSIYRNNAQGHLKFDYPMLAFSLHLQPPLPGEDQRSKTEKNSAKATANLDKLTGRYAAEKIKA
ncbi:hypothetical protein D770_00130 [Flammeovirgaceae bacterium 311]|nr:hypothetical protein D770_00130 [Flammeovirgaceae bacterium 311]